MRGDVQYVGLWVLLIGIIIINPTPADLIGLAIFGLGAWIFLSGERGRKG